MQTKVGSIDSISADLKSSKLSRVFFKKNGRFLRNPEIFRCAKNSTFDVPRGTLHFEQTDVKRSPKPQSLEAFCNTRFVTFEIKYENKWHILFERRYIGDYESIAPIFKNLIKMIRKLGRNRLSRCGILT